MSSLPLRIIRTNDQIAIVEHGQIADQFLSRLVGLIGRTEFAAGEGLLFPRNNSIHMWMMKIPLDVVFLRKTSGAAWTVQRLHENVKPWKLLPLTCFSAQDTLELPAGTIKTVVIKKRGRTMYRLVIVSGPNRGSAFNLIEGENSIGRQMDNHIVLTSSKVSKRHCAILVTGQEVFFRDESSTNGSFVNGALVRKQNLKPGDRISVGEFVLELARTMGVQTMPSAPLSYGSSALQPDYYAHTSSPAVAVASPANPVFSAPVEREIQAPTTLSGKIEFFFENKMMPFFYGILLKTEYRSIVAICFGIMISIAVVGAIMPMQDLAEQSIKREALVRARVLAKEVTDRYAPMIAGHTESQIDLSVFETEDSIKFAAITNTDLQIIAPQSRLNQMLASGREASFAIFMAKQFRDGRERGEGMILGNSVAVWIEPIKTADSRHMKNQVSAMTVMAVDFSRNMLDTGGVGVTYGIGFVIAGVIAALTYLILLRLTMKPFEILNDDLDQVLRGEISKVTHEFKIGELDGLWDNLNAAVQRIGKGGTENFSTQSLVNWDSEFAAVRAMAEASGFGFVGFDDQLQAVAMNPQFEEVSGIRAESLGQSLNQMARDQGFVALTKDLMERALQSPSRSALDQTEFSGVNYEVIAVGVGPAHQTGVALIFKKGD